MLAIFLDIETTGLDATHHAPIDIAFQVVDICSGIILSHYDRIVKQPQEVWDRHDPISLAINGFNLDMLAKGAEPKIVSEEIIQLLQHHAIARGNAVFICQNPAFDRSFFAQLVNVYTQEKLNWPYHWLDLASMYWAMLAQKKSHQHLPFPQTLNLSKNEIAREYGLPFEEEPHRAMNGVKHLMHCYQAVLGLKFEQ